MEEKQNCIQTPVNKGTAQFCYKKQKMESYIPLTTSRKRQIQQKKKDYAKKELITRIARWAPQLEEFDYEIEHRAGSRMKHVDALSRYPVMMVCNDTLTSKLKNAQEEDDNIQTLKSLLEKQESEEFFERNGILYKYLNGRELIVTPKAMQAELIKLIHENGHFSVGKAEEIVKQEFFIPNLTNVVKKKRCKKNIETLQSENRKTYNRRRKKASLYKEGDLVAIQRTQFGAGLKLRPKFLGPYKVTKVNSKDRYEVEKVGQHDGPNSTTTSADLMKHFYA
ncbi:uncharacterized protein TNCV_4134721 [Trichonephila clavipes]|nr:uncharacterized protein TNCV_4134721 [Trichonephila clavipes]